MVFFISLFCKWNSHGYDIAKIFGNKFTLISPVWLQVKRRGKERFQFTGLHDADKGCYFNFFCICIASKITGFVADWVALAINAYGFFWPCLIVKYLLLLHFWGRFLQSELFSVPTCFHMCA